MRPHSPSFRLPFVFLLYVVQITGATERCTFMAKCQCSGVPYYRDSIYTLIVDCSNAGLHAIPSFNTDRKIFQLLLYGNNITRITEDDFRRLDVKELDLRRNPLVNVQDDAFSTMSGSLKNLLVDRPELDVKRLRFLKGLWFLESLMLTRTGRKITSLSSDVFLYLGLTTLKKLSLQNCGFDEIHHDAFKNLDGLEELDLSFNSLKEIPSAIRQLGNLKRLGLDSNIIPHIPDLAFHTLSKLEYLELSRNDLKGPDAIGIDAFKGLENSLTELNFYHSDLTVLPAAALKRLTSLKMLSITYNRIHSLPNNSFTGDYQLKELQISGNPLHFHKTMFRGLEDSLEILLIRKMGLKSLPLEPLQTLKRLHWIDASRNEMTKIGENFNLGISANRFTLMSMQISEISPKAFIRYSDPIHLNLDENNMTELSFVLDAEPCTFETVDVSNNPVHCNCTLMEIVMTRLTTLTGKCFGGHYDGLSLSSPYFKQKLQDSCENFTYHHCYSNYDDLITTTNLAANPGYLSFLCAAALLSTVLAAV